VCYWRAVPNTFIDALGGLQEQAIRHGQQFIDAIVTQAIQDEPPLGPAGDKAAVVQAGQMT